MCGIAGILGKKNIESAILPMVEALHLRGPDDKGIWTSVKGSVALGHARLSIIDLSATGHQPMHLEEERYSLVYNGEIYNFNELKSELIKLGFSFRGSSDTEVILAGWKAWGKAMVARLRGMFAFALWDADKEELILARDRMGIKPLVYAQKDGNLIFGSSLDALLASGMLPRKIAKEGLFDLLSLGSVVQPRTIVQDVYALSPGTILSVKSNGRQEQTRFWDHKPRISLQEELAQLTYKEQVARLRAKLEEACRYHMIADVKVGSFLSGGVDSSAITALMARLSPSSIASFSIGFDNQVNLKNELSEAAEAAKFLGCEHHELILNGAMVSNSYDDFISCIDQPSYDGINTFWVSKMARDFVKVTLSGLGGDELFAGYDHFKWAMQYPANAEKNSLLLKSFRKHPERLARLKGSYLKNTDAFGRLATLRRLNYNSELGRILNPDLAKSMPKADIVLETLRKSGLSNENSIANITRYECENYLVNTLLRDADALSMGHSLEVRPVLLDNELVDFALALPAASKLKDGRTKSILKDSCRDLLPPGFFERKKKGFTLPTVSWLQSEMQERFRETMHDPASTAFFQKDFLHKKLPDEVANNRGLNAWMVMVLLEWAKAKNMSID